MISQMQGAPLHQRAVRDQARPTTEDMLSIVVGDLYARGAPREESSPITRVRLARGSIVRIEMAPLWDRVDCRYSRGLGDNDEHVVDYFLWVTWTRPHYGGERAWLQCGNRTCGRRCGRVFLKDPYLVCRACAGVGYPSQRKRAHVRRVERAKAIRAELGGSPVLGDPFPRRPKRMHRSRYARLREEALELERAENQRLADWYATRNANARRSKLDR